MELSARDTVTANEAELAPPIAATCASCHIDVIPTSVSAQLTVSPRAGGAPSVPLDAFTCLGCGRTELFATRPLLLGAPQPGGGADGDSTGPTEILRERWAPTLQWPA